MIKNVVMAKTSKGSLTACVYITDDEGTYCYSYGSRVASIINGKYVEYEGYRYFSNTSCRHKAQFRRYYGVSK